MPPPGCLPAWNGPPFSVENRIQELEKMLEEKENQHIIRQKENIKLLIQLYKDGVINGSSGRTVVQNGRVINIDDINGKGPCLVEMQGMQYAQSTSYPSATSTPPHHQFIYANMRLNPDLGGNGSSLVVPMLNDTGSDYFTFYGHDWSLLQSASDQYFGYGLPTLIHTANGDVVRQTIMIQLQLIRLDGTPLGAWFNEFAVLSEFSHPSYRLSGATIRDHYYFATARGHPDLYVAEKRHGIVSQLPAL
ncbi:MAG: hypothetical protein M1816_000625 [Peltula sp. TS41687]|nr:MAG: hypothetical protein M1816_000625 [Peltula sp. TS41687]